MIKKRINLFNRFLKENGIYYEYYGYSFYTRVDISVIIGFLDSNNSYDILDKSFVWSECNDYFGSCTNWSKYNILWNKLIIENGTL